MDKIVILNLNIKENIKKLSFFTFLLLISFIYGNIFGIYLIENSLSLKSLNVLKRGFLIGIFVEAFKVGS